MQKVARVVFRPLLILAASVALFAGGCSDKKKPEGTSSASPTDKTDEPKPTPVTADVTFLVEPCISGGIPADACKCAGEQAKTLIGAELLTKMSKAPDENDPKIASYYTRSEINQIMGWVEQGAEKCGIEEES